MRVEVADGGMAGPAAVCPERPALERGRGTQVMDALACARGAGQRGEGRFVRWVEVAPPRATRMRTPIGGGIRGESHSAASAHGDSQIGMTGGSEPVAQHDLHGDEGAQCSHGEQIVLEAGVGEADPGRCPAPPPRRRLAHVSTSTKTEIRIGVVRQRFANGMPLHPSETSQFL